MYRRRRNSRLLAVTAARRRAQAFAVVVLIVTVGCGSIAWAVAQPSQGTLVLVGDVLRYNHRSLWARIVPPCACTMA